VSIIYFREEMKSYHSDCGINIAIWGSACMHLYFVEPIEFKFWSLILQCADFYINAVLSTIFLVVLPGLSHLLLLIYLRYMHFCCI
jgi:hypothetical protein